MTWRPWDGGSTYVTPRRVGPMIVCHQELGYVERVAGGWDWQVRAIPGPLGEFATGTVATEAAARKEVEDRWSKTLETGTIGIIGRLEA